MKCHTGGYIPGMGHFVSLLVIFLMGGGCGFALALRIGGKRALWRLSMHEYAERLKRAGLR